MSIAISTSFDEPDPNDCPTTFSELIALENALVHSELVGSYIPYVTGAATPAVEDQDKVWQRVDANGRPLGTYLFYSGSWRRQYSGNIGQVTMYNGDPAVDFAGAGGAGTIGGNWDGWQLCNGSNNSPNLSDKFIVGARMDDLGVGYPSGGPWKTTVSGATTQEGVGVHEIQLNSLNTYRPAVGAITAGRWMADGNTPDVGGGLLGLGTDIELAPPDAGNLTPPAIPTLPPYYALAFVIFRGYA